MTTILSDGGSEELCDPAINRKKMLPSPLVFVFLGKSFPTYARYSLELAHATAKVPITVLSDCPAPKNLNPEITWLDTRLFYKKGDFRQFEAATALPKDFRDGFWLKTAERFFVLRDYMRYSEIPSFFHGELDCLFLDLSRTEKSIALAGFRGVFLPRETEDRVIASLVFVNNQEALEGLCSFLLANSHRGNEMDILGALPFEASSSFFALPSTEYMYRSGNQGNYPIWSVAPAEPDFIVDGAVMGRWLFGVDPRNTGGRGTRNRIQNQKHAVPFDLPLQELTFRREKREGWSIYVFHPAVPGGKRVSVIHVHSKIHKRLNLALVDSVLRRLNKGKSTRIVPYHSSFLWLLARRILRQLLRTLKTQELREMAVQNLKRRSWRKSLLQRLTRL